MPSAESRSRRRARRSGRWARSASSQRRRTSAPGGGSKSVGTGNVTEVTTPRSPIAVLAELVLVLGERLAEVVGPLRRVVALGDRDEELEPTLRVRREGRVDRRHRRGGDGARRQSPMFVGVVQVEAIRQD